MNNPLILDIYSAKEIFIPVSTPKPESMLVLTPAQNRFCIIDAKWSKCHHLLNYKTAWIKIAIETTIGGGEFEYAIVRVGLEKTLNRLAASLLVFVCEFWMHGCAATLDGFHYFEAGIAGNFTHSTYCASRLLE